MSFIHVPFETLDELVRHFHTTDFTNHVPDETCNLVLIEPGRYFGSYGGIFRSDVIDALKNSPIRFDSSPLIDGKLYIVWWSLSKPPFVGDTSLTKNGRVVVTPDLFFHMKPNCMVPPAKSSYYATKTDFIA